MAALSCLVWIDDHTEGLLLFYGRYSKFLDLQPFISHGCLPALARLCRWSRPAGRGRGRPNLIIRPDWQIVGEFPLMQSAKRLSGDPATPPPPLYQITTSLNIGTWAIWRQKLIQFRISFPTLSDLQIFSLFDPKPANPLSIKLNHKLQHCKLADWWQNSNCITVQTTHLDKGRLFLAKKIQRSSLKLTSLLHGRFTSCQLTWTHEDLLTRWGTWLEDLLTHNLSKPRPCYCTSWTQWYTSRPPLFRYLPLTNLSAVKMISNVKRNNRKTYLARRRTTAQHAC